MSKWFVSMISFLVTFGTALAVFAADPKAASAASGNWGVGLGAGLAIALAALGGALGQAKTASAFLEGVSRNPNARDGVFVPLIIGLAFIESLVLFAWLIAGNLVGKL